MNQAYMGIKMGIPSLLRIIQNVDLALKALEMAYNANSAAVEGLANRNGHKRKEVGQGKRVSWGCEQTKGKGRKYKLTKNMFFHNYLWQLCLKKKGR